MSFKELNISNPGTSSKYGGDDTDLINKLFNGVVAGIPAVTIKSQNKFGFWDNILWIENQAGSRRITIRGQSNVPSTNLDLALPPIVANDTLAAVGLQNIWSAKQQFNAGVLQQAMSAPSNPSAGFHHMYVDSLDGHWKKLDSTGTIKDYDIGGGVGSGDMVLASAQTVTGAKTFNDQKLVRRNPAGTFSGTEENPAITANETLNLFASPFAYVIYRVSSSVFKVLDCALGRIVYNGNSPLAAFQAARAGMGSGTVPYNTGTSGGMTLVKKGIYQFTAVDANDACFDIDNPAISGQNSSQRYYGEGQSTVLQFIPSSPVGAGIQFKGWYNGLENMKIQANANITDAIRVLPVTPTAGSNFGTLHNLRIEGWNGTAQTYMPALTGIHLSPGTGVEPVYEWDIHHIYINNMLCGVKLGYDPTAPQGANNNTVSHVKAGSCDYAVDVRSVSNKISHIAHQGNTSLHIGIAAVHLTSTAGHNVVSDITPEIFNADMLTNRGLIAAAVVLEDGAYNTQVTGVTNSGGTRVYDANVVGASTWGSTNTIRTNWKGQNSTTETLSASPALIVNTGQGPQMYFVYGGVITKIEIGRATLTTQAFTDIGLTGPGMFLLDVKEALQITYTTVPTVKWLTWC